MPNPLLKKTVSHLVKAYLTGIFIQLHQSSDDFESSDDLAKILILRQFRINLHFQLKSLTKLTSPFRFILSLVEVKRMN